jgi:hypothetical protein
MIPDDQEVAAARRDLVKALVVLCSSISQENSLAARNVTYHAEELLRWMDSHNRGEHAPKEV